MADKTPNLGLPLITENMTANVPRDMNALAQAMDDAAGLISIPDASLTVKGKTQLSSATDSSLEDRSATPKAVKEAYDRGSAGVTAAQAAQTIINNRDGYGTTTNSGNAYAVTLAPTPTAYVDGLRITIKVNAANTGAVTINVNGLGAKSVLKSNGGAMTANALRANSVYSLVYNGTAFILQGEGGEYGTATASQVLQGYTIGTENGIISGTLSLGKKSASGVGYFERVGTTSEYRLIVTGLEFTPTFVSTRHVQDGDDFIFLIINRPNIVTNAGFTRVNTSSGVTYNRMSIQTGGFTLSISNRDVSVPVYWTADE